MSFLKMNFLLYKKMLRLASYRRRAAVALLAYFGATASIVQVILWLSDVSGGTALTYTLSVLMPIGIIFALRVSLPSAEVVFRHPTTRSTLRLSVGDLFEPTDAPIVITMNRYFDTLPPWVSRDSLVSQLISRHCDGNFEEIRSSILAQLNCDTEAMQAVGKIIQVDLDNTIYLLIAVSDRSEETRSTVAVDQVWTSLSYLWRFARQNNLSSLRVPVIGSGYARANVGRIPVLILLLTSYLTSAMEVPICDLEIIVAPNTFDPDMLALAKNYCEILGCREVEQRLFEEGDLRPFKPTLLSEDAAAAVPHVDANSKDEDSTTSDATLSALDTSISNEEEEGST